MFEIISAYSDLQNRSKIPPLPSAALFLLVSITFEIKYDQEIVSCLLSVFVEEATSLKEIKIFVNRASLSVTCHDFYFKNITF